jgi:WD40 repeat protein
MSVEELKAQFDAYVTATDKRLAALEEAVAAGGAAKKPAGTPSRTGTLSKPAAKTPTSKARPASSGEKKDGTETPKTKPTLSSASAKKENIPEIDEKRIGSFQVGKRKVYYVIPSDYVKSADEDKPVGSDLKLDFVYGYNGRSARNNLFFDKTTDGAQLIYCVAATGVKYDPSTKGQSFFIGHNEDILCLAVHPSRPVVATGQLDPKGRGKPYTSVWDHTNMSELARIDGFHDRGVIAAAFLPGGKYLATVGNDDSHTMGVFDWESDQKKPVAQCMVAKDEVFGFALNVHAKDDTYEFVTFGNKHLKYFTMVPTEKAGTPSKDPFVIKGNILSSFKNTGVVQKAFYSALFLTTGDLVIGTHSGELYVFKGANFSKSVEAHKSVVGALVETPTGFASAGSDGLLIGWNNDFTKAWQIDIGKVKPKSMDFNEKTNKFVIGTSANTIVEVGVEEKKAEVIMEGHSDEIWGLSTHPSEPVFITCANDKTLRFWDTKTHQAIPGKLVTFKDSAVCCNYSPDGKTIAVGFDNGKVALVESDTLNIKYEKKHHAEQVAGVVFSPNGQLLAVGSWDQTAQLMDLESKSCVTLKGHTSSVTHLSFSEDSKFLVTNSKDYEILFWNTETGKRVDKAVVGDVKWWDWQCILGFPVRGIFGAGQDGTDNNAAHVSYTTDPAKRLVATGNDTGEVSLFRYPASQKSMKKFIGHSSHVTNVRFSRDDEFLVSTGGNDTGVFLWKITPSA